MIGDETYERLRAGYSIEELDECSTDLEILGRDFLKTVSEEDNTDAIYALVMLDIFASAMEKTLLTGLVRHNSMENVAKWLKIPEVCLREFLED